jgi:O-antigen ligase
MVVIGIVGLVAWAGLIVGPLLAFVSALIPVRKG